MLHQYKISYMWSIDGKEETKESYNYAEAETKDDAIIAFMDSIEQELIDAGIDFDCDEDTITTSQTFPDGTKQVQKYYNFNAEKEN